MENFTEQLLKIRDYFDTPPSYPQPHSEEIAMRLLAAMIASGKYELEEYPRLVEAAIRLSRIFVVQLDFQMRELTDRCDSKPTASEQSTNFSSEADYDPIPF